MQLRIRSVEPSTLSLLGLVRHMADVERGWFRRTLAGEEVTDRYSSPTTPMATSTMSTRPMSTRHSPPGARSATAPTRSSRDARSTRPGDSGRGREVSMRWILNHMIEEYSRHNGHADLLRERIDGATDK